MFLSYTFIAFALLLFGVYYFIKNARIRLALIIVGGFYFLWMYGGFLSLLTTLLLAIVSFLAGRYDKRIAIPGAIVSCVLALVVFKYDHFLLEQFSFLDLPAEPPAWMPAAIPLGISFFTFEFVHYLVDVRKGHPPIRNVFEFLSFAFFWPTLVSGPIKRYEQFVPALHLGLSGTSAENAAYGLFRVVTGLAKKWAADNITGWIGFFEPQYTTAGMEMRWVFIVALSARILLDFSGYSDIAIGYARLMGITVPENFNWPYIARSPAEFWQRWHMSLSLWIRDYIYIPLGGNRLGPGRRVLNALTAMVLCGFWHGPSWNFAAWGLYHGFGLVAGHLIGTKFSWATADPKYAERWNSTVLRRSLQLGSWATTMLFVGIGWLLFFYPVGQAASMAYGLLVR